MECRNKLGMASCRFCHPWERTSTCVLVWKLVHRKLILFLLLHLTSLRRFWTDTAPWLHQLLHQHLMSIAQPKVRSCCALIAGRTEKGLLASVVGVNGACHRSFSDDNSPNAMCCSHVAAHTACPLDPAHVPYFPARVLKGS
jgi:hypothetical protein